MEPESKTQRQRRSPRRFLRFSLRGLLVLVAICSVWFGIVFSRAREQARAVAAIKAVGGQVYYDYQFADWYNINYSAKSPTPTWFLDAVGIDFVHEVDGVRFEQRITDDDLAALESLPQIRILWIQAGKITNRGLGRLGALTQLQSLLISSTSEDSSGFDDSGLTQLRSLHGLRLLGILGTKISDNGLQSLKALVKLDGLLLCNTRVTRGGVQDLSKSIPKCSITAFGENGIFGVGGKK
jgi:hypothetical protein